MSWGDSPSAALFPFLATLFRFRLHAYGPPLPTELKEVFEQKGFQPWGSTGNAPWDSQSGDVAHITLRS